MTELERSPQNASAGAEVTASHAEPVDDPALTARLRRLARVALIAGLAATVLLVIGFFFAGRARWVQSYLVAHLYWLGLSLGCLFLLLLHHLVGGPWGFPIQRLLTAGSRPLFLLAPLFLPILLGAGMLYVWADPAVIEADAALQAKAIYLNLPLFALRAVLYFAVWLVLAFVITRNAYRLDETGERRLARRSQRFSGPGLILLGLTATFAAVDWAMSLEPHWYSSIYGLLLVTGQVLVGLAFALAFLGLVCDRPALSWAMTSRATNDLGALLLAALISWIYALFMQFLIIWFADLPQEVTWYLNRMGGGWQWLLLAVVLLHFALPFGLILVHKGRWRVSSLAVISAMVVVAHFLYLYWLIMPAFSPQKPALHWLDLAAVVAVGGLWLAWFLTELGRHSLVPYRHPRYLAFIEEEQYETAA